MTEVDPTRRERPAEARTTPEATAVARGGVREGLDWLGRVPETTASPLVRGLAVLARLVLLGAFRFRIETAGRQHIPPSGGYLAIVAVHRGWMDPFVILDALPLEPRVWFLGSGPSAFSAPWRERLLHRVGGMLPVWRGGVGIDQHVRSAQAVLDAGGVFVLVPEGGVAGPPDAPSTFRVGSALIAIRTGAPMLPIVIVGTHELYIGKRMAARILPPTTVADLMGPDWDGVLPPADSRAELDLARAVTERLTATFTPAVAQLFPGTVDPLDRPRRLRGLTWLFLARPRRRQPAGPNP